MGKRVLFTPVGGTDPISWNNWRDGAILQICRKYKPNLIYMYMSAEILENQKKDDRYRYCINQLAERMGHEIKVVSIERPELHEVQKFNFFYVEFSNLLEKISEELESDDELLLNVSSGTPAMKSALMVLSSLTRMKCRVIQVRTPTKGMNEHNHPKEDIKELWECNEDNDPDKYEDRTEEVDCPWIVADQKKRLIRNHVLAYDYEAAISVHEQMPLSSDGTYVQLLKAAAERKQLNDQNMLRILREIGEDQNPVFRPIKNDEIRMLFEYTLATDIRQKKGEYSDFLRALTPLIVELFLKIIKEYGTIDIKELYLYNNDKMKRWNVNKIGGNGIETVITRKFESKNRQSFNTYKELKSDFIYSVQLLNIILEYVPYEKNDIRDMCIDIRIIEDQVRNRVAHEIVGVSDRFIKSKVGYNSEEIMNIIKKLLFAIDGGMKKYWDSYDKMNTFILERMETELI